MNLKPDHTIDLEHRAYFIRGQAQGPVLVAAAEDGWLSFINLESSELHTYRLPSSIRAVSLHPLDQRLAWVNAVSGALTVQKPGGKPLYEIVPPPVSTASRMRIESGFADCYFDESNEHLWVAAPLSADELQIMLIDTKNWSVVDETTIQDSFGGSTARFYHTGRPDMVCLWLAAGQDGQQVYWLNRQASKFTCTLERFLENTTPPVFPSSGSELLVLNQDNAVYRHSFPEMHYMGPPLTSVDDDDIFAESLCYFNERQALAGTNEGRVFLIDTESMRIQEEVAIEGHEPRPIAEYFPTLATVPGLATDLTHFERVRDVIVFVYHRDRGTGLAGWKDTLLLVSIKE